MLAMEGMARLWTRQSSGYQRLWKLKLRLLPNTRVSPASPAHPGASRPETGSAGAVPQRDPKAVRPFMPLTTAQRSLSPHGC
jgi:hypothetical protein